MRWFTRNRNKNFWMNGDFKLIVVEYQKHYNGWTIQFALLGFELMIINRRRD
jgi:hypothetical protein